MSAGFDEITQLALTLPVDQRAQVASALLASLDDPADSAEIHRDWTSEIGSRVDDIVNGEAELIPGEQVFAELAERRAARESARRA